MLASASSFPAPVHRCCKLNSQHQTCKGQGLPASTFHWSCSLPNWPPGLHPCKPAPPAMQDPTAAVLGTGPNVGAYYLDQQGTDRKSWSGARCVRTILTSSLQPVASGLLAASRLAWHPWLDN